MNTTETKRSQTEKQMIREIEVYGKTNYVHGNGRRSHAAKRLIAEGYHEEKIGYNFYRMTKATAG